MICAEVEAMFQECPLDLLGVADLTTFKISLAIS